MKITRNLRIIGFLAEVRNWILPNVSQKLCHLISFLINELQRNKFTEKVKVKYE
jgi:hypothetical protein